MISQRVRYIGPLVDCHGIEIHYTFGTVTAESAECVSVQLDDNAYAQSWAGHVGAFVRCWAPLRYVAKVELYNIIGKFGVHKGQACANGYSVSRFHADGRRMHLLHDFERDEEGARARAVKLNADPAFQLYLPSGYPDPTMPHRLRSIEQHEFVSLGYSEAEAWTLYYSQCARVVADPLSPHGGIIQAKAVSNLPLTPREQNWIDERIALRTDPAIRLLMDTAEHAGAPIEQTQEELAGGELERAGIITAWRTP